MRSLKIALAGLLFTFICGIKPASAATIAAANCQAASVQAAINSAANGDTVTIPAGTCTWTTTVNVGVKALTIQGVDALSLGAPCDATGTTITHNISGVQVFALDFTQNGTQTTRVTGMCFLGGSFDHRMIHCGTGNGFSKPPFRIDHNSFQAPSNLGGAAILMVIDSCQGLADHNVFLAPDNSEMIHLFGDGDTGWTQDVTPGSQNMFFVEDNTFTNNHSGVNLGNSAIQSYQGSRLVFRHNTLTDSQVDEHGTAGEIGARWYELYENTFVIPANGSQDKFFDLRAGSGVVYNNHKTGSATNADITLREEDGGTWPVAYQIGSGINGGTNQHTTCSAGSRNQSPLYIWGNDTSMAVHVGTGSIVSNRDYFVSTTQPVSLFREQISSDTCSTTYNYVAAAYPHALQGAVSPSPAITSVLPALGPIGTQITVTGTSFGASQSTITIGALPLTINTWSDTSIVATIPNGAATGHIVVTVGSNSADGGIFSVTTNGIPIARQVDWTHVGIPGGIPNNACTTTLSASGGSDDSVAIQNAINAASAGAVVCLNPGNYTLHRVSTVCTGKSDDFGGGVYEAGLCLTDKSIVLRGLGTKPADVTLSYGDGANIISMGQTFLSSLSITYINITAGASKGSSSITLASVAGLSTGNYLAITQTNPNDADGNLLANPIGYAGSCDSCGHDQPNKAMIQIDRITGIAGNVVTLERPLYIDYTNTPQAYKLNMIESVGLENLRVVGTATSGTTVTFKNINLEGCAHCWVHNVESDMSVDRSHIYLGDAYECEISNNYVNDGFSHNSGETYAIFLEARASENLIQNNIIRKARHSTPLVGTSGNVFGYNYAIDPFMGEFPNSLPETQAHGVHPYMNLFEGNVYPDLEFDYTHGSSSHNTVFRNYLNMTSTNPSTGLAQTAGLWAVAVAYWANYENFFGNAIGNATGTCKAANYEINADATQNASIFKLGYFDDGGTTTPNANLSAKIGLTILRGGNWDCKTNSVVWSSNVPSGSTPISYAPSQTLPASLYLAAKPAFFNTFNVTWPPVDPIATPKVNKIPAQLCFEAGPAIGQPFNPSACYAPAPAVSLSPSSIDFGSLAVGGTSSPTTVTVFNVGTATLTISSITLTGVDSSQFSLVNTCGATVAAGANCTVSVTFHPSTTGVKAATLTVTDSANDSPQGVPLVANATSPANSATIKGNLSISGNVVIR